MHSLAAYNARIGIGAFPQNETVLLRRYRGSFADAPSLISEVLDTVIEEVVLSTGAIQKVTGW
jgi:hypothetical protein